MICVLPLRCYLSHPPRAMLQTVTQVQKLELDWPPHIRNFFSVLNVLSLSLSALSPRCVVSDWQYLNKVPMINAAPVGIFLFLMAYKIIVPRAHYVFCWVCCKALKIPPTHEVWSRVTCKWKLGPCCGIH